jgi:hypothetical protein
MPSSEWDYFKRNFFGDYYVMWHDGVDATSVCALKGAERDRAEEMLIESMQKGSPWAPMGLRELRSQKAVPIMKELLSKSDGDALREIAIALNVIEDTNEYNQYIIQVLRKCPSAYSRLKAAHVLRDFSTPAVIEALFDAVSDIDYLVRSQACESLLAIHGLEPMITNHDEIFQLLKTYTNDEKGISKEDAATAYKKAEVLLRALFEK